MSKTRFDGSTVPYDHFVWGYDTMVDLSRRPEETNRDDPQCAERRRAKRKVDRFLKNSRRMAALSLAALCLAAFIPATWGHNLDQRFTYINLDPDTLDIMRARALAGEETIQVGDELHVIMKSVPGPGTLTGVGGYMTFYLPTGGQFQVVRTEYLAPDPNRPGYYIPVPIKGQSIIAVGSGPIGPASTPGLIGLNLGANINGVTEAAVTAAGVHRGTIAGVYADTGIFFSTNSQTSWLSWENGTRPTKPGGGTYPVYLTNNRGESIRPRTWWDAAQLIGYGMSSPHSPAIDPNGRGSSPWGLANVVAGPESGYAWDFDLLRWVADGYPGYSSSVLTNAVNQIGPWNRIQYPGSQVSLDQAGLISSVLGYAGIDASGIGHELNEGNPLPLNTTAVRFSFGMLELGRAEIGRIHVKVMKPFETCPFPIHGDAFGGDAGGEQGGKDHLWRYYDPSDEIIDLCGGFQKRASKTLVVPGEEVTFTLSIFNVSSTPRTGIIVRDPLPSGMSYVAGSASLTPTNTNPLTWDVGTLAPFAMTDITFRVRITGVGELVNVSTLTSDQGPLIASDSVRSGYDDLLEWDKTVTPSSVAPGDAVTYTIEIFNVGTGPNGVPMTITDYLPAGFAYQSMVSKRINGGLLPDSLFSVNAANSNQPIFTVNQGIQAGQALELKFKVRVGAGVPADTYYNSFKIGYENKAVASGPDAPVTVGAGRIGDTVWRDWNGNGIQDTGEEGISNVTMRLYSDVNSNGMYDAGTDTLLTSQATDANGQYLFEGLSRGRYIVTVATNVTGLLQHALTYDPDGGTAHQAAVTLDFNEGTDLVDFGYRPGGAGVGTGSIGDKVFDDNGAGGGTAGDGIWNGAEPGISNVTVNLYEDTNGNGELDTGDLLIAITQSSTNGSYLFSNLATNMDYFVDLVESDSDLTAYFTAQGKTLSATTAGDYSVLNLAGASLANDFGFVGISPGSIGDQVFLDTNSDGIYSNSIDQPLPSIGVDLYVDANTNGVLDAGDSLYASTHSDASGLYTFLNLPQGFYIVDVDQAYPDIPPGYAASRDETPVPLAPGQNRTDVDFPFAPLITKAVDRAFATTNDVLTYTLGVSYVGNQMLQNARVVDPLPAGVTFSNATAGGVFGSFSPDPAVPGIDVGGPGEPTTTNSLAVSTTAVATGGLITVTMTLRSDQTISNVTPSLAVQGGSALITGPAEPFPTNVVVGTPRVFTFTCRPSSVGVITLVGSASGAAGYEFEDSLSQSILVSFNGASNTVTWTFGTNTLSQDGVATWQYRLPGIYALNGDNTTNFWRYETLSNKWATKVGTPGAMEEGAALVSDGGQTVYALRGNNLSSFYAYDASNNTWSAKSNTPANVNLGGALTLVGGYVYALGGNNTTAFWRYDTNANTWVAMTAAPAAVRAGGSLTTDGTNVYTFRGNGQVDFWRYNVASNTWTTRTNAPATVGAGGALTYRGGYVYGFGGNTTTNFWRYNPASNTWTTMAGTPANVADGGALTTDGAYLYGFGGNNTTNFWRYDTGLNTWSALAGPPLNVGSGNGGGSLAYVPGTAVETRDSEIAVSRTLVNSGTVVTVTMQLQSTTDEALAAPTALTVVGTNGANATLVSGPTPTSQSMASNTPSFFTWTYLISSGTNIGSVTFRGGATNTAGRSFGAALSHSVIVTPPLQFRARVNSPVTVSSVDNFAAITESSGAIPSTPSDIVRTALSASIGDRIWDDLDEDGVQDPGEPGLDGIRVILYNGAGSPLATNTTDASGIYHFYGLSNGTYRAGCDLSTAPAGYYPTTPTLLTNIVITSGLQYTNADFGLHSSIYVPTASVGDQVFLDANSNGVYDAGDAPLANVTVSLYHDANGDGVAQGGEFVATNVTDVTGIYCFGSLSAGIYIVAVDTADPDLPAGAVASVSQYTNIVLSAGLDRTDMDFPFTIPPAPALLSKSVSPTGSVRPGDVLTYTVTPHYTNSTPLTNVVVRDPLPGGTTYVGGSANAGGNTNASGEVVWYLGTNTAGTVGYGSIDLLAWNTFLGGSGNDNGYGVAVDGSGNTYVTGYSSTNWGSPVRAFNGTGYSDAFVAKLDSNGNLVWNTFLGGNRTDEGYSIAVDGSSKVYVTGKSGGTWGSPVNAYSNNTDAFVAKLDSAGNLIWNTFIGDNLGDEGQGIAVDGSSNVYVGGYGSATWGSPVRAFSGNNDGFVAKLDSSGGLIWHTFLGETGYDMNHSVAVDGSSNVVVAAHSQFTWGSPVRAFTGNFDGFAAKLDSGGGLTWHSFLGGADSDMGSSVAVDSSGNVYVAGYSGATWGSPVMAFGGSHDAFASKLSSTGTVTWNTFYGGSENAYTYANGIAVDGGSNVYWAGNDGNYAFASKLSSTGTVIWNISLGSSGMTNTARSIAVAGSGAVYMSGDSSTNWGSPVRAYSGGDDAYVAKLGGGGGSGEGITLNSTSSAATAGAATNLTWSHTVSNGNHRILTVGLSMIAGQATSVTYGGAALTLVGRHTGGQAHTVEIWQRVAPAVGTANIVATFDAAREVIGGAQAFNGVHQTAPTGTFVGASAESTATPSVTVSSAPDELVIDALYVDLVTSATAGAGQTKRWGLTNARTGAGSTEAGASSVVMSWTLGTSDEWDIAAVPLKPAPSSIIGTNRITTSGPLIVVGSNLVTVTMTLTASETVTNVTPMLSYNFTGGATATLISSPTNVPATVTSLGTAFSWVYSVTSSTNVGSVSFSGSAKNYAGIGFPTASAGSLIVIPPLTFQVTVNGPAGIITNAASIAATNLTTTPSSNVYNYIGASLGDTVWADEDRDGVQDTNETGIANVKVFVDTNTNGVWNVSEPYGTTDLYGSYHIYGLTGGAYTVRYDTNTVPAGATNTTQMPLSVTITNFQAYTNADFGLYPPLTPPTGPSSLGDTVWLDRNNNGAYDAGDEPITNVTVRLYVDMDSSGALTSSDVQIGTMQTDTNGHYQFTSLNAGDYLVLVDTNSSSFPVGLALTTNSPAQPNPESVSLGVGEDESTIDFGYNYTASIGDLVWYDNNGNGIYEPGLSENGVPHAVALLYEDTNEDGMFEGDIDVQVGYAMTATNGTYLLDNLSPGIYFVKVYAQSVVPEGCTNECSYTLLPTTENVVTVDLDPGENYLNADFGYKNGSTIEGTIFYDINHDSVYEPQLPGTPETGLTNITVWLDTDDDGTLDWTDDNTNGVWDAGEGEQWTVTGANGDYKFFVTAIGNYLVRYDTTDPDIPAALQGVAAETTPPAQYVNITILGEEREDIDFGRDNTGRVGDLIFGDRGTSGTYDGSATDPGLANAVVELYQDDGDGVFDPVNDPYVGATVTDADGNYLFPGLPDGTYFVNVLEAAIPLTWQSTPTVDPTSPLDGTGKAIVSGGSAVLTMDFGYPPSTPGNITGTVYDDGGFGRAGDGQMVIAVSDGKLDMNRNGVISTNDDGAFESYTVIDGSVDADGSGVITTNDDLTSLRGFIIIDGGFDLNRNGTVATNDDGFSSYAVITGKVDITRNGVIDATDDGTFRGYTVIDGLVDVDGSGTITALDDLSSLAGYPIVNGYFDVDNDTVTGEAADAAGVSGDVGVVGVVINLFDTDDNLMAQTATDGNGNYRFNGLRSGSYIVEEIDPVTATSVTDKEGDTTDPAFNLISVTVVAGTTNAGNDFLDDNILLESASGQARNDADADGDFADSESGISNVTVRLFVDLEGDGNTLLYTVIDGAIDVDEDGLINTNDDATLFCLPVLDGKVDVNNDRSITSADDLASFNGIAVIDGYLDVNGSGAITAADDGTLGAEPLIATTLTATNGMYSFTSLAFGNYVIVETDPTNAFSTADVYGANDNEVAAVVFFGGSTGNDFLDALSGTVSGHLYQDVNGNGIQDVGETNLVSVDVLIQDSLRRLFTVGTDTNGNWTATVPPGQVSANVVETDPQFAAIFTNGYVQTDGTDPTRVVAVAGTNTSAGNDGYFDPAGAASLAGTVYRDTDLNGFGGADAPVGGIPVSLYVDMDSNRVVTFYTVTNGLIDVNGDGTVTTNDDGVILDYTIIDGFVDVNNNGAVTADDDGFFNGIVVVDGRLDLDRDGNGTTPDADDCGRVAGEPLVTQTATAAAGTYAFAGLRAASYVVVETDPTGSVSVDDRAAVTEFEGVATDSQIGVLLSAGENSVGNDFLDSGVSLYTISGTVWNDTDLSTNFSAGDRPIGGVTVNVYADADGDGALSASEQALGSLATAPTDLMGRYTLSGLANGNYIVVETDPTGATSVIDTDGSTVNGPNAIAVTISGASVTDRDFLDMDAVLGAIGDRVWLDADGDGMQDAGEAGLGNVALVLYSSNGVVLATNRTDNSGEYLFAGIVSGTYTVSVVNASVPTGLGPTAGSSESLSVVLATGQVYREADFGYRDASATPAALGDQVWSDANANGIQDPGEPGIGNVSVALKAAGSDGLLGTADDTTAATTTTRADGMYLFTNVAPGEYRVDVTDTNSVLAGYTLSSGPQSGPDPTMPITVTAGDTYLNADFGYRNAGLHSISDRVWYDSNADGLTNAAETGLADVSVTLVNSNGVIIATAGTGTNGHFTFSGVPNGSYTVAVNDTGGVLIDYLGTTSNAIAGSRAVTVSGADVTGANFGYVAPATIGDTVWSDANANGIQDPGESGIGGVQVVLWRDADGDGVFHSGLDLAIATNTTDDSGQYLFTDLSASNYFVSLATSQAALSGYTATVADEQTGPYAAGLQQNVILPSASASDMNADFGLRQTTLADMSGSIFTDFNANGYDDGAVDPPLSNVTVALVNSNGVVVAVTTTATNGYYVFPDVTPGSYTVHVTDRNGVLDGYRLTTVLEPYPMTVAAADLTDIDFGYVRHSTTAAIGDRVWYDTDGDGAQDTGESGIANVLVDLYRDANSNGVYDAGTDTLVTNTVTGADGGYLFNNLAAGFYFVVADGSNTNAGEALYGLTATTNGPATAVIALSEGENYNGADLGYRGNDYSVGDFIWADADHDGIQDPGEAGISRVVVCLLDSNSTVIATMTNNAAGGYYFTGLATGKYHVAIAQTNFAAGETLFGYTVTTGRQSVGNTMSGNLIFVNDTNPANDSLSYIDFGFDSAALGSISGLVWYDGNGNGATNAGEFGLTAVTVNLADTNGHVVATVATDASGHYRFTGAPPGSYRVDVTDVNHELQGLNITGGTDPSTVLTLGAGGAVTDVNFGYNGSGGAIGNSLWHDLDNDGHRDADEPGLQGVTLNLWLDANDNGAIDYGTDNLVRTTTTDADGNYLFIGLSPTTYLVDVTDEAGALAGMTKTSGTAGADDYSQTDPYAVTLSAGAPSNYTADFGYYAASGHSISGTVWLDQDGDGVRDAAEMPADDITVALYRDLNGNGALDAADTRMGALSTDVNGEYTFANLPNGMYIAQVTDANGRLTGYTHTQGTPNTNDESQANPFAVTLAGADIDYADFGFMPPKPTAAFLGPFRVYASGGQVVVEWQTVSEVDTVGFHLYRQTQNGSKEKVNATLLPGLLTAPQGGVYRLVDPGARPGRSYTYELIEMDTHGQAISLGRFDAQAAVKETLLHDSVPTKAAAENYTRKAHDPSPRSLANQARLARVSDSITPMSVGTSLRIRTDEEGLCFLSAGEIGARLGLSSKAVAKLIGSGQLRLTTQGIDLPWATDDLASGVLFLIEKLDSIYTRENVYWLTVGRGLKMGTLGGKRPSVAANLSFLENLHFEQDAMETPALFTDPEANMWMWNYLFLYGQAVQPLSFPFQAPGLTGGSDSTLRVVLYGATETGVPAEHHARILLNGTVVAETQWEGMVRHEVDVACPPGLLLESGNTLEVVGLLNTGVPYSFFYVDRFDVAYRRAYRAVNDRLFCPADTHNLITVDGFTSASISVLDITARKRPSIVNRTRIEATGNGYRVSFCASARHCYLAVAAGAYTTPLCLDSTIKTTLRSPTNAADYLIIAPASLLAAAESLAQYRREQGLAAMVVALQDIYDEFNAGIANPWAIRSFLGYAYRQWTRAPRYVVLAGEGSYDYRNLKGFGDCLVPPAMTATPYGLAVSDTVLADVDSDGVPEMAIGRMPVASATELDGMRAKIVAYEAGGNWKQRILMMADNPDTGGSFHTDSDAVAALVPPAYTVTNAYLGKLSTAQTRSRTIGTLNGGCGILNYLGHGGQDRFAQEGILTTADANALTNGQRSAWIVGASCTAGNYGIPGYDCLAEVMAVKTNGGAVAMWVPVSLTLNAENVILDHALFSALFEGGMARMGDAIMDVLDTYATGGYFPYMLRVYNLIGDPATAFGAAYGLQPTSLDSVPASVMSGAEWLNLRFTPEQARQPGLREWMKHLR